MRIARGLAAVVIVCCAVEGRAEEAPAEASLAQAQKDLDEARRLYKAGKYAEAIPPANRALQFREKILGPNRPEVAECLSALGEFYRKLGSYTKANPLFQRTLRIRESTLGKSHPDVASSLNNLANLYSDQGAYEQAEPLYQRALQIREVALGKKHPDVAWSLNNLAALYFAKGLYAHAEPIFKRALQIWEVVLGKNHPDVALALNNLAEVYIAQGLHEQAEPLYQRALQIREAVLGTNHPDVAWSLNNLASLYFSKGSYNRAEPLYQRALQIREAVLGKHHRDVAVSLNNLANLYRVQGAYDRAELLYQRTLQMWETILGKSHPDVAQSLNNLAVLYIDQGLYDHAKPLYQRALQILEATLGRNHPIAVQILNNLAVLYVDQGLYDHAEPLYQRTLEIREATLGKKNPLVAQSLNNLAVLYMEQGLYDRAEPLYQRALQIREAALGENHPAVSQSLENSAKLYLAKGQLVAALPLLERSFTLSEGRLRREAVVFSEARLASFLSFLQAEEQTHYSLVREHPFEIAVLRLALTTALLRKGRSAAEIADTSRAVYRNLGQADLEAFQRLRALRAQFSSLSLAGPEKLAPAAYQTRLQELMAQADALEAELAQRSALLRAQRQLPGPADVIARVSSALPPDGALIEIVAFSASPVVPPPNTPPSRVPSTPAYLALVLLPSGDTRAVDLGPAEAIDDAVRRLHRVLSDHTADYLPAAQELYRLVFQPLVSLLGTQRRLFISPDGQLNLISFAALHDGTRHLADAFDFTYLTSGQDLVRTTEGSPMSRSVVVLADPAFQIAPPALAATTRGEDASSPPVSTLLERSAPLERFFSQERWISTAQTWDPLPGTRKEAQAIHKLFPQAQLLLGPAATKQALLAVTSPGILHIATHGFVLGDAAAPPQTRGRISVGQPEASPPTKLPPDPLLRAVLVLAGAQAAQGKTGDALSGLRAEDTLATALELAGLNLWGTELVVLSACDTGRGEVKPGQGVYGLRRAFTVAGAESLVTSLWRVNDETTHELMTDFYRQLKAGQGRAEALRMAMQRMRKRHAHPYYWAPFILVGNGAPLRSLAPSHTSGPRQAP